MDIDATIRTIIDKNPGIKTKHLLRDIHDETKLEKSASFRRLHRLIGAQEIFREHGHYWSEMPSGATKRAYAKHVREIIAGLLVLAGRGRYTMAGEIVPDPGKAKVATQHLKTGYPSIHYLSKTNESIFQKRVNRLIEELKTEYGMPRGYCKDCEARLPRRITAKTLETQKP